MSDKKEKLTEQQRLIATRIEARREELGIPHAKMAEVCDIDRSAAYRKARHAIPWNYAELALLAPVLNISVNELLNGKGVFLDPGQEQLVAESIQCALEVMMQHGMGIADFGPRDLSILFTEFATRSLKDGSVDSKGIQRIMGVVRRRG
jgi:hypothetical protein